MIERASGIVLRTRRLTESSLIIQWLTDSSGRISTVAKGALRPKSPLRGKLDLFYLADFTFSRSRRSELHTLREVSLHSTHPALRQELGYLQQASYCAALIEQSTEIETPLPQVYELLRGFLEALPRRPPGAPMILAFELKMLGELGLAPDLESSHLGTEAAKLVASLAGSSWDDVAGLSPTDDVIRQLRQYLHGFLIYHLGRLARGREAALNAAQF